MPYFPSLWVANHFQDGKWIPKGGDGGVHQWTADIYTCVFRLLWSDPIRYILTCPEETSIHAYQPYCLGKIKAYLKNPGTTGPNIYCYDYPTEYKLAKITL